MKTSGWLFGRFAEPHERLFLEREYAALRGERGRVSLLLFAMMLATLLAVVLARSGMHHLKLRMADPFTSLLSINTANVGYAHNYEPIRSFLDSCAENKIFHAARSSGNYTEGWHFHTKSNSGDEYASVISFGFWKDHELLERILQTDNLVDPLAGEALGGNPEAFRDGVIISKEFLDVLECDLAELRSGKIVVVYGNYTVPLRVLAVVQTLPGRSRCLVEHTLLMGLKDAYSMNTFPDRDTETLEVLVDGSATNRADELDEQLSALFNEAVTVRIENVDDVVTHPRMLVVERINGRTWDTQMKQNWQERLTAPRSRILDLRPAVRFEDRLLDPDSTLPFGAKEPHIYRFDQLTITFDPVDQVDQFQTAIRHYTAVKITDATEVDTRDQRPVELDLDRVESRKNFGVVASLGNFLLASLVLFSMLSIVLYLYNLLRNHLERLKMNLGTFMAFGLSPALLKAGYLRIIVLLLLRVAVSSVGILLLLQAVLWAVARAGGSLPPIFEHVSVLGNPWLYLCVAGILASSIWICQRQLSRFLTAPPGDLIYDRK